MKSQTTRMISIPHPALTGALALSALMISGCARAQNAAPAVMAAPQKIEVPPKTPLAAPFAVVDWQPVALMNAAQKAAPGVKIGGEGAQWVGALAWSDDGKIAIWGTDVGGLFRSLDGGGTWEPCNVGYTPRGTTGLAFDPNNSRRVLSVGANSLSSNQHGIWLSENGAASWSQVLPADISGMRDFRDQLAFDPATYDDDAKLTRVVYWSRVGKDKANFGKITNHPALYKSLDGGRTWNELPDSEFLGQGIVKTAPRGGVIYVGTPAGVQRSSDGGKSWTQTLEGEITGLDVCAAAPGSVWATRADALLRSDDGGLTWQAVAGAGAIVKAEKTLRQVRVSPLDPNKIVLWRQGANYDYPRFASSDGGATWKESRIDKSLAFLPTNARQGVFAWNPTQPNTLLSTGGDYPTISTDGGQTYRWTGDGVNNMLIGGGVFHFNARYPDTIFFASQDYNGASTLDGGKTWKYQNVSGKGWGGFVYGGYALSPGVMVAGEAKSWGGPREITVTRDGGKTWTKTGYEFKGGGSSLGAPNDPNVVFADAWRSGDAGQTWTQMQGCARVLTADKIGNLWGASETGIVMSRDNGASWRAVAPREKVADLAVDPDGNWLLAVAGGDLWKCDGLKTEAPKWTKIEGLVPDQKGAPRVKSVAIDPVDSDLVYIATNRDVFCSNASAQRSRDGGVTWENLTRQTPLDGAIATGKDGAREAIWVRVHPQTREAWFSTSCYGTWKVAPPA